MKPTFSIGLAILGAVTVSGAAFAQEPPAVAQAAAPLTVADFTAGASLRDNKGTQVGTITSADASTVVVDTGQTKIGVPMKFFAKDKQGLALLISADQFNAAVAKAHARSEAAKAAQDAPGAPKQ